jgi:uncharacterized protein
MISRRTLLMSASLAALVGAAPAFAVQEPRGFAEPFPLSAVRLKPSIFLDAVNANRAYLMALEPGRLLHNFHVSAGLSPKGELYGGWEARGIAGHTLGHYLSACSLLHAQTGDEEARARVHAIVAELALCQVAHGDGYVGGTTVERGGAIVDGKIVFEEIRRGDIRSNGFDLNGGWVPLYTWHKVHQGLLDAHAHCGDAQALTVATGLSDYLIGVFAGLDDAQMQRILAAEHGGLNETYAEMFARTGDARYLAMAERIRHRAVLDPITEERDQLAGLHANTQIPKIVGLARLHEVTGEPRHATAARFFWNVVTRDHSYVIGGNSEREHFAPPRVVAPLLTDRTCEACNSYNMLRLTRHLWRWRQDSAYFDYFERAHLNHIMAHQNPATGMFVYFMPMTAGARRQYSTPTDSFWCCVGSGMESHAKHGESIFARQGDTLFVNLFIPAYLDWRERGARFELDTVYPNSEEIHLRVTEAGQRRRFAVAMRLPAWCAAPRLTLNGREAAFERRDGYAIVRRVWRDGDTLTLTLPMTLRVEPAPDDPRMLAFLSGPVVLAADLGHAAEPLAGPAPALVSEDPAASVTSDSIAGAHVYRVAAAQPAPLTLRPFYLQYDRRTAVYLRHFTDEQWRDEEVAFRTAEQRRAAIEARTIDVIHLGEMQPERDHNYRANQAELISYGGVAGRQAWWGVGNYIEFDLAVRPGPMVLQVRYWGEDTGKDFDIKIDGAVLTRERRADEPVREFITRDYPLPAAMTRGKARVTVRFETRGSDAPVYQARMLTP